MALPPAASTLTFTRRLRAALQQLVAERKVQLLEVHQGQLLLQQGQRCPFVFAVCRGALSYANVCGGDVAITGVVRPGQFAGSLCIFSESFVQEDTLRLIEFCYGEARRLAARARLPQAPESSRWPVERVHHLGEPARTCPAGGRRFVTFSFTFFACCWNCNSNWNWNSENTYPCPPLYHSRSHHRMAAHIRPSRGLPAARRYQRLPSGERPSLRVSIPLAFVISCSQA